MSGASPKHYDVFCGLLQEKALAWTEPFGGSIGVAQAVPQGLLRTSRFVFPNPQGTGPMTDLGCRWQNLRALARLARARTRIG